MMFRKSRHVSGHWFWRSPNYCLQHTQLLLSDDKRSTAPFLLETDMWVRIGFLKGILPVRLLWSHDRCERAVGGIPMVHSVPDHSLCGLSVRPCEPSLTRRWMAPPHAMGTGTSAPSGFLVQRQRAGHRPDYLTKAHGRNATSNNTGVLGLVWSGYNNGKSTAWNDCRVNTSVCSYLFNYAHLDH